MTDKERVSTSKLLSLVLRHKPEFILTANGVWLTKSVLTEYILNSNAQENRLYKQLARRTNSFFIIDSIRYNPDEGSILQ